MREKGFQILGLCFFAIMCSSCRQSLYQMGGKGIKRVPAQSSGAHLRVRSSVPKDHQGKGIYDYDYDFEFVEENIQINRGKQFEIAIRFSMEGPELNRAFISLDSSVVENPKKNLEVWQALSSSFKLLGSNRYEANFKFPVDVFPRGEYSLHRFGVFFVGGGVQNIYRSDLQESKFNVISNENSIDLTGPQVSEFGLVTKNIFIGDKDQKFKIILRFKATDKFGIQRVSLGLNSLGEEQSPKTKEDLFSDGLWYGEYTGSSFIAELGGDMYEVEFSFPAKKFLSSGGYYIYILRFTDNLGNQTTFFVQQDMTFMNRDGLKLPHTVYDTVYE